MDIFSVITLLGGLALFLYGMNVMSDGLEKIAGGKLEQILNKMTSNIIKSLALGAFVTMVIQSSSALTVMLVGLVNSGVMSLSGSIGVIMGSNIGTTFTAWILSLTGLEGSSIIVRLFKPESFSPLFAFVGTLFIVFSKENKKRDVGLIFIGFALLMYGMEFMSGAVEPLRDMPQFSNILTAFQNPILGVVVGALFTAIIQSSSASVGILQALSLTGSVTYAAAIPIIMGQNIGTCITPVISGIGAGKSAKRVAAVHVSFNVIGTVICLTLYYILKSVFNVSFIYESVTPVNIAVIHSLFNIITTFILLPWGRKLEKLAFLIIPQDKLPDSKELLDERLLLTTSVAIGRCRELTNEMARISCDNFIKSIKLLNNYNSEVADEIDKNENLTDMYEDKLGSYLVKISRKSMSVEESHETSNLLHTIGDFERISDHAVNMVKVTKEIHNKKITFTDVAKEEVKILSKALEEILSMTFEAFYNNDLTLAKKIEPLEQVVDKLIYKIKSAHVKRLQKGVCAIETGFVYTDFLTNCARVADHCSNVAVCLIQISSDSFDTHAYLNSVKTHDEEFNKQYNLFIEKYNLGKV